MANIKVPNLRIVGGVWRTWYRHQGKILSRSTGIKAADTEAALKFSRAITQFRTTEWNRVEMYGQARAIHPTAADAHYGGMIAPDDSGTIANATGIPVEWPVTGMDETEVIALNEALRRSRLIERDNLELKQQLAEKTASEAALLQALGQKSVSDKLWSEAHKEYLAWGRTQGGRGGRPWSFHHNRKRTKILTFWEGKLKPETLADITLPAVRAVLQEIQGAPKTRHSYLEAIRSMMIWCVDSGYISESPLENAGKLDSTPETTRRALNTQEIGLLLSKCKPSRRTLYALAICSGLRKNELKSLVVGDLDIKNSMLRLHAEWTKNRKPGWHPLPVSLTATLEMAVAGLLPNQPLIHVPDKAAQRFQKDIAAAGIAPETPEGVACFACLRQTYITLVDGTNTSAKTTQELARHAPGSPLTQARYAKTRAAELRSVVEQVGAVLAV